MIRITADWRETQKQSGGGFVAFVWLFWAVIDVDDADVWSPVSDECEGGSYWRWGGGYGVEQTVELADLVVSSVFPAVQDRRLFVFWSLEAGEFGSGSLWRRWLLDCIFFFFPPCNWHRTSLTQLRQSMVQAMLLGYILIKAY